MEKHIQNKLKARFIGKDSLGYENGKVYNLKINKSTVAGYEHCPIIIERDKLNGGGLCPYESLQSFMENWVLEDI